MRVEFTLDYPIEGLTPADYNPRFLEDKRFQILKKSLSELGVIKPVIVNGDNGVLTAGHQRTKAMQAVGIKTCPVIRISDISRADEIQFNLMHNSIETNKSVVHVNMDNYKDKVNEYVIVSPKDVVIESNLNAPIVDEIGKMMLKYGEWGSVIMDVRGNIIDNSDYAVASKLCNQEMITYVLSDDRIQRMRDYFKEDYGEYYFDKLGIKTCHQFYAQPQRLGKGGRANFSILYETRVIDKVPKDKRILDFGAGKCAYVNYLRKRDYNIFAYEPNFRVGNNSIDVSTVVKMIQEVQADVTKNGLYDYIVLDSVLNSVVNSKIENYVLATVSSLMKYDGKIMLQTRSMKEVTEKRSYSSTNSHKRLVEFLDKENFCAVYRDGVWTTQHFHTKETLGPLLAKYYDEVEMYMNQHNYLCATCSKPKVLPLDQIAEALDFEFNIEYPGGYHHNKHGMLKRIILKKVEERNARVTNCNSGVTECNKEN